jgi:hypothetical protein
MDLTIDEYRDFIEVLNDVVINTNTFLKEEIEKLKELTNEKG